MRCPRKDGQWPNTLTWLHHQPCALTLRCNAANIITCLCFKLASSCHLACRWIGVSLNFCHFNVTLHIITEGSLNVTKLVWASKWQSVACLSLKREEEGTVTLHNLERTSSFNKLTSFWSRAHWIDRWDVQSLFLPGYWFDNLDGRMSLHFYELKTIPVIDLQPFLAMFGFLGKMLWC